MSRPPAITAPGYLAVAIIVIAITLGVVALVTMDRSGEQGSGLGPAAEYDLEPYRKIPPERIGYVETGRFSVASPLGYAKPSAMAVDDDGAIHIGGEGGIGVYDISGKRLRRIDLEGRPTCLAIGGESHAFPGRVYAGVDGRIVRLGKDTSKLDAWQLPGKRPYPTSIALSDDEVYVADADGAAVWRYDSSGKLLGAIGQPDEARGTSGLGIPSPFFDVLVGTDDLIWLVNPAAVRLQAHTPGGNLEYFWGESEAHLEGFFGCCNPAHIAQLSDGRFVTAEKGLLRVKVYSTDGILDTVVAGPEQLDVPIPPSNESQFDHEYKAVEVAVDPSDRILVFDPRSGVLRVYEAKQR